jgi:type IV pilus assembly protein PilE
MRLSAIRHSGASRPRPDGRGFTLTELLIVVVVVAILAMIALPAYENELRRSRRAAAEAHLLDIAQRQQQYLLDVRGYAPTVAALGVTTPADVAAYYTIAIVNAAGPPRRSPPAQPPLPARARRRTCRDSR